MGATAWDRSRLVLPCTSPLPVVHLGKAIERLLAVVDFLSVEGLLGTVGVLLYVIYFVGVGTGSFASRYAHRRTPLRPAYGPRLGYRLGRLVVISARLGILDLELSRISSASRRWRRSTVNGSLHGGGGVSPSFDPGGRTVRYTLTSYRRTWWT